MPHGRIFSFINRYSLRSHRYTESGILFAMLLLFVLLIYLAFFGPVCVCLPMAFCLPSNIWHLHT